LNRLSRREGMFCKDGIHTNILPPLKFAGHVPPARTSQT
jgi:hypothetical protein